MALEVVNVSYEYDDMPLFKGIDCRVKPGQLLYLKGSNGAGKTTLLKLLAGLKTPVEGSIKYGGQAIDALPDYQQQIAYVSHQKMLNDYLTVKENCLFNLNMAEDIELNQLLAPMQLEPFISSLAGHLSAGQKRKVVLCQLPALNKKIWLLDEPLTALDSHAIDVLCQWIMAHLNKEGIVVMTSHQAIPLDSTRIKEYKLA